MLERDSGAGILIERQFDPHLALADFARYMRNGRMRASVLRPREPLEPNASWLSIVHAPESGRRRKERDDLELVGARGADWLVAGTDG